MAVRYGDTRFVVSQKTEPTATGERQRLSGGIVNHRAQSDEVSGLITREIYAFHFKASLSDRFEVEGLWSTAIVAKKAKFLTKKALSDNYFQVVL
jgi:hypothetical protein